MHFGIGFETSVDSVVIRWPLGYKQVLTDVAINQYHEIKEPDYTSVESRDLNSAKPSAFLLEQNYPNPFNAGTTIEYNLARNSKVIINVYDMLGREIITLVNGHQNEGVHPIHWDGCDNMKQPVASGIYLYRIEAGEFSSMKKLILIK